MVDSYRRGELYLPHLRGRTIYERPVQAAEHFLREATGNLAVEAYRPLSAENEGEGVWRVQMAGSDGGEYTAQVAARRWPELVYETCNATEKSTVEHYELLSLS